MFNRVVETKIVKRPKEDKSTPTDPPTPPMDYVIIARDTAVTLGAIVVVGVISYVAADTIRQVLVKLTPQH